MPAALMFQAGISAIDADEARSIWSVGGPARWLIDVTFIATLMLSVPIVAAVGVVLAIFFLSSSASDVRIRALEPTGNGGFIERGAPVTLPSPHDIERPFVVLRLRGRTRVGATLAEVLENYAEALADASGRLYLSGVDDELGDLLKRSGILSHHHNVDIVPVDARPGCVDRTGDGQGTPLA